MTFNDGFFMNVNNFHPTRWKWFSLLFYKSISILRPEIIKTKHGFDLFIPKTDRSSYLYWLWIHGEYEKEQSRIAKEILKEGDLAVDVGANMGYYTCLFSKCVGDSGDVVAFEPEFNNFESLSNNLSINQISNVKVVRKGLSDQKGLRRLYLTEQEFGNHSFAGKEDEFSGHEDVEVDTLDGALPSLVDLGEKKISLMKIDVEGFELKVLRGAQSLIGSGKISALIVEYSPYRITKAGDDPLWFFDFIVQFAIDFSICESSSEQHGMSVDQIRDSIGKFSNDEHVYFYFYIKF
jgi:FkbM family methyltransferase